MNCVAVEESNFHFDLPANNGPTFTGETVGLENRIKNLYGQLL